MATSSSPELQAAVIDGLRDGGSDVIDIGLCGTEEVYFATDHFGAGGGIMVTASHNPIDYNGRKLVGPGATPLAADAGRGAVRAAAEAAALSRRLVRGERPLFFPEGTSTDGLQVLPFRTPLFQSFLAPDLPEGLRVQPVSVRYIAPAGQDARVYGWWGDTDFAPHLLSTLSLAPQGRVEVTYHPPVPVEEPGGRKALAARAEAAVRSGHSAGA